jgi:hypothetical protein
LVVIIFNQNLFIMSEPYNRIVLIGNGFDKALRLKTGYTDFILYYIKKVGTEILQDKDVTNRLFTGKSSVGGSAYNGLVSPLQSSETIEEAMKVIERIPALTFKNNFLKDILNSCVNYRWVDIEQHYYETLIRLFKNGKGSPREEFYFKNIKTLNECMDELEKELKIFIKEQQIKLDLIRLERFWDFFEYITNPLSLDIFKLVKSRDEIEYPKSILFVNFNYTDTVIQMIKNEFIKGPIKHLFIHGTVNDNNNPIIFGYGDDTSDIYKQLELENNSELLRKIKSFQYPRTHNYHNLLSYLEEVEFEVFIVGHSCGLSDRTLLKTIFEHQNCNAIQIFHYRGEEEHFYKRIEISRHFSDKALMRERVLPFDEYARIPQFSEKEIKSFTPKLSPRDK